MAYEFPVFCAVCEIGRKLQSESLSTDKEYNQSYLSNFERECITMDRKTTNIVAYLTWVGLIIAYVMGDRNASRFHLNQSLVIWLVGTVAGVITKIFGWIPLLGWMVALAMGFVGIFVLVCWFIGIIGAIEDTEKPVPVLGQIQLLK